MSANQRSNNYLSNESHNMKIHPVSPETKACEVYWCFIRTVWTVHSFLAGSVLVPSSLTKSHCFLHQRQAQKICGHFRPTGQESFKLGYYSNSVWKLGLKCRSQTLLFSSFLEIEYKHKQFIRVILKSCMKCRQSTIDRKKAIKQDKV